MAGTPTSEQVAEMARLLAALMEGKEFDLLDRSEQRRYEILAWKALNSDRC